MIEPTLGMRSAVWIVRCVARRCEAGEALPKRSCRSSGPKNLRGYNGAHERNDRQYDPNDKQRCDQGCHIFEDPEQIRGNEVDGAHGERKNVSGDDIQEDDKGENVEYYHAQHVKQLVNLLEFGNDVV